MIVICKEAGAGCCPQDLNICCFECSLRKTCGNSCQDDPSRCKAREEVAGEQTGFSRAVPRTIQKIAALLKLKQQLEEQEKELRRKLQTAMELYGVEKWENDTIAFTRVAATTRTSVDSAKLKKLYPDIARECSRVTPVAATMKVVLK